MSGEKQHHSWSHLSEEDQALLLQRLGRRPETETRESIPKRPQKDTAPLSFSQEQVWFLDQFDPGLTAYVRPWALRIRGRLDLDLLEKSLHQIVRRHEALRTVMTSSGGEVKQRIQPFRPFNLPLTDLSKKKKEEKVSIARKIAREEANQPFELTRDSIIRPRILKLSSDDHLLLLTTHHIAFDGWSERVMFRELCHIYTSHLAGSSPGLPEPDVQFPDFAQWQRERLTKEELDRLGAFWKGELEGAPPLLNLRTDYERPSTRSYAGESVTLQISEEYAQSLKQLARQEQATLFMALLAAYYVVLYHHSGEPDIVVGGTVSGRHNLEVEDAIGFFVDTLTLRTRVESHLTFRSLLAKVRESTLRALSHQDLPFEKLVELLNPPRHLSYTPVVQASIQLRILPDRGPGIPGLKIEEFDVGSERALFDLSLSVEEIGNEFHCKLVYNRTLFTKDHAQRMLHHFRAVVQTASGDPGILISELGGRDPGLSPEDRLSAPLVDPAIQDRSNLTGTQLMVWAGQKFRPDSLLYNLPYTFEIQGHVDRDLFQQSLQILIDTNESLRTIITEEEGIPQRKVLAHVPADMGYKDFSSALDPKNAAIDWIKTEFDRAFDLTERLFHTTLIQLDEKRWMWFLHIHHIIVDNVSVQIIFDRLNEIYRLLLEDADIGDLTYPQFAEFVSFEKNHRTTPKYQRAKEYWSKKLASPVEPLRFYGDRKLKENTRVKRSTFNLEDEYRDRLLRLAEKDPFYIKSLLATLNNIFAGVIFAFLYRITESKDLSLGVHFHNRRTSRFEGIIGLLMEVLPLQISIEEGETFASLMDKVNQEMRAILAHRSFAIGNPYQHPTYEVTLNYQTVIVNSFLGAATRLQRIHNGHEEDTLGVQIRDYGASGNFTLDLDFHEDVFSEEDQERSLEYFQRILKTVLDHPEQRLDQIELLSDEERDWQLYDINRTQSPYSEDLTIIDLFERQVKKTPENIAVKYKERTLTYHQLDLRANQLAQKLRSLGPAPGHPIALLMDRSPEMVVAMLAILKSGRPYLPLDPNNPSGRLEYILDESGASTVVSQTAFIDRLSKIGVDPLFLDDIQDLDALGEINPGGHIGPRDAAYVIFTSGSTGVPKGVLIEHHSLVNFVEWAIEDWKINPTDRVLQFTSISWDAHIEEFFPTLCSGATLVLRTETMIDSFQEFMETVRREEISAMNLPTAFWHELADALGNQGLKLPSTVRLVNTGGDRASPQRVARWLENVSPDVRLVNTYGLTESTSIATQFDLSEGFRTEDSVVPIGKPINNVQTYVLDQRMNPVPIGMRGELWIGGEALARGYLNRPELTKEDFKSNPFTGQEKDRIYRSGDVVRLRASGNLEMLGRVDNQVKIRGFRVELGEIEVVLNQHTAVEQAVVVVRGERDPKDEPYKGEKRIIAYYLPTPGSTLDQGEEDLRHFLRDKLPEYMIPSHIFQLKSFPLTAHGKVDLQALPVPDRREMRRTIEYLAPRNPTERQLVEIWEQVLDASPIGVKDNFFDLGGHSLLAVRLFSRIESELGIKLPLMTLFDAPTISNQARSLLDQRYDSDPTWVVEVQSEGSKPPFFCISPSVIDVITYRELSRNMGEDQPFYALYSEIMGLWREGEEHLETITNQFLNKIHAIQPSGPYFIGGYSAGGIVALEIAKALEREGFQVGLVVLIDTFGPNYPRLLPGITPGIFNALLVLRRIQSYLWKFLLLDWKGRLQYLRFPRIHTWVRDRYGEVRPTAGPPTEKGTHYLSHARRKYDPGQYQGNVLLIRAKKGLLGIHRDPKMGWGEVFLNEFEVCMVPGDHEAILFGPRSKYVADQLNAYLAIALKSIHE